MALRICVLLNRSDVSIPCIATQAHPQGSRQLTFVRSARGKFILAMPARL
jgi:hypothetical protein